MPDIHLRCCKRQLLVMNTISWQNSFVCDHNLELMNLEEDFYWSLYPSKHRMRAWTQTDLTAQIWLIFLTCVVASPLGFLYWQRWSSEWPWGDQEKNIFERNYENLCSHFGLGNNALYLIILIKITRTPSKQSCDETNLLRETKGVCYLCQFSFCLQFWAFITCQH